MSTAILERLKTLAVTVEGDLPAGVQKLTVVLEQKAEAAEAALAKAGASIPAELEEYLSKIETSVENHTAALKHLFETHAVAAAPEAAPEPVAAAEAPPATSSDAVPSAPVL